MSIANMTPDPAGGVDVSVSLGLASEVWSAVLPTGATLGDLARQLVDLRGQGPVVYLSLPGSSGAVSPLDAGVLLSDLL
eukprot:CAMPEP_0179170470 /NCGR_PEP_ID=MMETSP0796-20121207/83980_1 /TAXON_ID=73915 /ORGANISM="Pyrodinium bahamense, Strain pbaha01" /LENGTH=78 /DNA_ID=CAMNT_0020873449 /DNA_START=19 /DNA_END=255 /DNA_ORIENTATION=-